LLLDNNRIGDAGAAAVADALPTMALAELNIGFNDVGADGLTRVVTFLVDRGKGSGSLETLTLSGNTVGGDVSRLIAHMLVHNTTLRHLYLDHTAIGPVGEKNIAAGIASSKCSGLRVLTGFDLGRALTTLGRYTISGCCAEPYFFHHS
jgi:Ran GTPase-activating protein (RanGAP) involved in mRNA processing and transport